MAYKIPKRASAIGKTVIDPLGLGLGDAVFGKDKGPDYSAEEAEKAKALADNQAATDEFTQGGASQYASGEQYGFDELGSPESLGNTELGSIRGDERYKEQQLRSLQDLQDQSQNGFNASDRADMARTRSTVDTANRGRQQAIQQQMQSKGQGGGGLEMVAQMQAAQDSAQIEALRAMETEGNAQQRKTQASAQAGNMATNLSNQEFSQDAAKAAAQDRINQFNVQNSNQNAMYNNQHANAANEANVTRRNQTGDRNTAAAYDYRKDVLGAKQGQNTQNYNAATDDLNGRKMDRAAAEQAAGGKMGMLMGTGAAVAGGIYGGPKGAAAGAQVGQGVGSSVGKTAYQRYAHGGEVPGEAPVPGDSEENDVVAALLSPGEVVVPRSIAQDPEAATAFIGEATGQDDSDPIAHLLKAMSALHAKKGHS